MNLLAMGFINFQKDDTYPGLADADKSPRIDLKYSTWYSKTEHEYHMEAKNLIENNWKREAA